MKTVSILSLLPIVASAATLQSRQSGAVVAGIDKLEPRIRTGAQRTLTKFGPYTLRGSKGGAAGGHGEGHSMGGMGGDSTLAGQTYMLNIAKGFCNSAGPCTVLGGQVGVMFTDGVKADPAKGVYIHHVLTADLTKQTTKFISVCNNPTKPASSISSFGVGTGFVGTGEDSGDGPYMYTSMNGTSNNGYHIEKGDKFLANVQLVNYNKEDKQVYITYDLEYMPGKVGGDTKGILISATQCGTQIKMSQTGPATTTSGKFTFLEDGSIMTARGHLHDGGVAVDVAINGKPVCTSKAGYGGAGSETEVNGKKYLAISSMSVCGGPIPVKKGDALTMNILYDLVQHPLRESAGGHAATGVMGMVAMTFTKANQAM
ncbi:hypothetical protein BT63DRAFT_31242 [Microthyrium microscopicum]|uniref:Uncharacterized protein n=1 Tax=Microthyrium microscopicum TaxID=703497 RepID=A0A6A6USC8_9PEZI|nr:hypothetical protein BT63DRAFT_31242 [Microthyrium microscopicum]